MSEKLASHIADLIERIGGLAISLPSDEILLTDIDDLRSVTPGSRRRATLRQAKRELLRRFLDDRLGPDAVVDPVESRLLDEVSAQARSDFLAVEIANIVEMVKHLRAISATKGLHNFDCFAPGVERECGKFVRATWGATPRPPAPRAQKPTAKPVPEGVVYFVSLADPNELKIGFSTKVKHRLRALQTASSVDLTVHLILPGTVGLEAELHARFDALRIRREHFRLEGDLAAFIAAEKAKIAEGK